MYPVECSLVICKLHIFTSNCSQYFAFKYHNTLGHENIHGKEAIFKPYLSISYTYIYLISFLTVLSTETQYKRQTIMNILDTFQWFGYIISMCCTWMWYLYYLGFLIVQKVRYTQVVQAIWKWSLDNHSMVHQYLQ